MRKFTSEEKLLAVQRRFEKGESFNAIAVSIGADETTVNIWCRQYESMGAQELNDGK